MLPGARGGVILEDRLPIAASVGEEVKSLMGVCQLVCSKRNCYVAERKTRWLWLLVKS